MKLKITFMLAAWMFWTAGPNRAFSLTGKERAMYSPF